MPLWAIEVAERFWLDAGETPAIPRDLRGPISLATPLAVEVAPNLRTAGVQSWLYDQRIYCDMHVDDRALRACLLARAGRGLIFLDGHDHADEQRFSLAHELAHFLRHYQQPRERAAARLGRPILEVLDGERPPRLEERGHALLAGHSIGFHTHLMARDEGGQPASEDVFLAEREADLLACELLAPSAMLLSELERLPGDYRRNAAMLLSGRHGLPAPQARRYAGMLFPSQQAQSFLRKLGVR